LCNKREVPPRSRVLDGTASKKSFALRGKAGRLYAVRYNCFKRGEGACNPCGQKDWGAIFSAWKRGYISGRKKISVHEVGGVSVWRSKAYLHDGRGKKEVTGLPGHRRIGETPYSLNEMWGCLSQDPKSPCTTSVLLSSVGEKRHCFAALQES